jgi:hypothetical protein
MLDGLAWPFAYRFQGFGAIPKIAMAGIGTALRMAIPSQVREADFAPGRVIQAGRVPYICAIAPQGGLGARRRANYKLDIMRNPALPRRGRALP